jgi:hypothetical protein
MESAPSRERPNRIAYLFRRPDTGIFPGSHFVPKKPISLEAAARRFVEAILADERRRVVELLDAHKADLGMLHIRLVNLVNNGVDLQKEKKLPIEERASGFHWDDE